MISLKKVTIWNLKYYLLGHLKTLTTVLEGKLAIGTSNSESSELFKAIVLFFFTILRPLGDVRLLNGFDFPFLRSINSCILMSIFETPVPIDLKLGCGSF